jgi:hypothetical protein
MIIYKTTNLLTGEWYIGQDKHNRPTYLGSGKILVCKVKKYGKHNFKKEILEVCNSIEELNKAEEKWIDDTNAVKDSMSYNLRKGGCRFPEKHGSDNHNFGKYPMAMVEKTKKPVVCLNDGRVFDTLTEASRYYNIHISKISLICKLKRISSKGFVFRYLGQEDLKRNRKIGGFKKGAKPVNIKKVICIENNIVFDSITEAVNYCQSLNTKTNRQSIRNVCDGKYKTAAGMKWGWYVN